MPPEMIGAVLRDCYGKYGLDFDIRRDIIQSDIDASGILRVVILVPSDTDVSKRVALEDLIREELKIVRDVRQVRVSCETPGKEEYQLEALDFEVTKNNEKAQALHEKFAARKGLEGVKRIFLVCSGKGGVGKSTVALNTAIALQRRGHRVSLLDLDIYGPSVPTLVGSDMPPMIADSKILPLETQGLSVMSIGFLIDKGQPLIWRGPMLTGVINQLLRDVDWSGTDYMVIDMPPGTGDTYLTLLQDLKVDAAVVVTTPSDLALEDALRGVALFEPYETEVAGIVENMSAYAWEGANEAISYVDALDAHTGPEAKPLLDKLRSMLLETKNIPIFGQKTRAFCEKHRLRLLASVPMSAKLRRDGDEGTPFMLNPTDDAIREAFDSLAAKLSLLYPVYKF